jgi:hypothetical protein
MPTGPRWGHLATALASPAMSALLSDRDLHRAFPDVSNVPILLQKSLAALLNSDSVVLMRFAVEAIDDGAAQSRPR